MTDTHSETKTKTLYINNITLYHCALWKSQVFIQTTWVHTCGARLSSRSSSGRGQPSHWGLSRRGGALRGRLLFCGVVFFNQAASQRKVLQRLSAPLPERGKKNPARCAACLEERGTGYHHWTGFTGGSRIEDGGDRVRRILMKQADFL